MLIFAKIAKFFCLFAFCGKNFFSKKKNFESRRFEAWRFRKNDKKGVYKFGGGSLIVLLVKIPHTRCVSSYALWEGGPLRNSFHWGKLMNYSWNGGQIKSKWRADRFAFCLFVSGGERSNTSIPGQRQKNVVNSVDIVKNFFMKYFSFWEGGGHTQYFYIEK